MTKAIFFDIDGTLVPFGEKAIPASTRQALQQLRRKGIKIFIATGRPWSLIDNLGNQEFDGYITVNGSHCFTAGHHTIHKGCIPQEDLERLITFSHERPYTFVFVHGDQLFATRIGKRMEEITRLINLQLPPVLPIETIRGKEILQMMGYFTAEEEKEEAIFERVLPHCEPMRWHPLFADIIARGNSKSTGIDKMLAYYDIKLEDTMAFGDGGNDIPMLKHVAIGVAMGNAGEEVKAVANYVTSAVDQDGIANALKHFGLI